MLKDLRVLISDEGQHYRFAKADIVDQGQGLMMWLEPGQTKTSRHSDGLTFSGKAGAGQALQLSLNVPFSDIRHEFVCRVLIPSDATRLGSPYLGATANALVFPTSALHSSSSFAAELVDAEHLPYVLKAWQERPGVISAQTWVSMGAAKAIFMTILSESNLTNRR